MRVSTLFGVGCALLFVLGFSIADGRCGDSPAAAGDELKRGCIKAAIRGINLEIERCQRWIELREKGKVDDTNLPGLKTELERLRADLATYQGLDPREYGIPSGNRMTAWIEDEKPGDAPTICFDGMSKSGPWFHLTGIAGDDYGVLRPRTKVRITYHEVYPRNYFRMHSAYVYVSRIESE